MARGVLGGILAAIVTALRGIVASTAAAGAAQPTQIITYDNPSYAYDVGELPARVRTASELVCSHPYCAAARNEQGARILDDILNDPAGRTEVLDRVTNTWDSTGRGFGTATAVPLWVSWSTTDERLQAAPR